MTPRPLALLVAGRTVERMRQARGSDFADWFATGLHRSLDPERNEVLIFDPRTDELPPDPSSIAGIVVTGSADMVTEEAAWSLRGEAWLRLALDADIPIFGVCYGHQMLARIAGGRCDWNPRGREIGTVEVRLRAAAAEDELFGETPVRFPAQCSHSQSVVELPPGSVHLASSDLDPHQAFRVSGRSAWGVQFHPEFDAEIVRGYLEERRSTIESEGLDVDGILKKTAEGPDSTRLLARFDRLCRARET